MTPSPLLSRFHRLGAIATFGLAASCSSSDSGGTTGSANPGGTSGVGGTSNSADGGSAAGATSSGGAAGHASGGQGAASGGRASFGGATSNGGTSPAGGAGTGASGSGGVSVGTGGVTGACVPEASACDPNNIACCTGLVCVTSTSPDYAGCRIPCTQASDCASGCCIPFGNFPDRGFCGNATLCQCSAKDEPCGGTKHCCSGFTCTTFDSTNQLGCEPLCKTNADCATNCCVPIPTTPDSACLSPTYCGR